MKKALFTTHPSTERERKNLLLLNLIKKQKTTSRTDLSKSADINIVTVSNYVNNYIKKGFVIERGYDVSTGGRRPELIELNKRWGYVIGIDIGENYIKGALTDLTAEILAMDSVEGYDSKNAKVFIEKIIEKLLSASKIGKDQVKKVGIGVSAISEGAMEDIIKIKEKMDLPALCGTGALCASSGEKNLNLEAKNAKNILYIYKDRGQGIFVRDNEFYEAGDKFHGLLYLKPWGEESDVINAAKSIIGKGVGTKIVEKAEGGIKNLTLENIIKAQEEGDEIATDLLKTTGVNLGVRIAYLVNMFEPDSVIIGGGIEEAGELFFNSVKKSVDRFIAQRVKDRVKLTMALSGKDACVKGAAFLAVREALIEA